MAISDAKIQIGLPAGASGIKKSDGATPTVRYLPVGPNLVSNSGFETNTAGWTGQNSGTIARDTGVFKLGAASGIVTRGTTDWAVATDYVTAYPNTAYAVGGWMRIGTAVNARVELTFHDAANVQLGAAITTASTSATFVYQSTTGTAPAGTTKMRVWLYATTSGTAYYDGITLQPCVPLVESPYAEPTATGSTTGGSLTYTVAADAHYIGDVKVFDMAGLTDVTLAESSYTRVYGTRHKFTGHPLVDNGIFRVRLSKTSSSNPTSVYVNGAWQASFNLELDTGGDATVTTVTWTLKTNAGGKVVFDGVDGDGNSATATVYRGRHILRIDTTRVKASNAWQDFTLSKNMRFTLTDASKVLRDDVVTATNQSATSFTEPYALAMTPGTDPYMIGIGFPKKPTSILDDGSLNWRDTAATTSAFKRTFFVQLGPWPWLTNGFCFVEAEDGSFDSLGASIVADAAASGGNVARFDAINEVSLKRFQANRDLPYGDYTLVARAKDSAQVTNDFRMNVYNETDVVDVAQATKTLTASYAFYTLDFSLTTAQSGDTLWFGTKKATSTANNIDVDYYLIIPRTRNSSTPSHVFFPRDIARNALMNSSVRDSIRRV